MKAIRKYCLWCANSSAREIKLCPSTECPLYPFKSGRGRGRKLKAIRLRCIDCVAGETKRVTNCKCDGKSEELCPLFPYRMGKNPKLKGKRGYKVSPKSLEALKRAVIARKNARKGIGGLDEKDK